MNRRVLIILDVDVLNKGTDVREKVGNPVQWSDAVAASNGGQPRAVVPQSIIFVLKL